MIECDNYRVEDLPGVAKRTGRKRGQLLLTRFKPTVTENSFMFSPERKRYRALVTE
jgi:hypothetical protein